MLYQSEAAECGLACIAMVANQLGLTPRALKLDLDDLKNLRTPCILHWEMNHFVVLQKVHRSGITILDPAMGERRLSFTEVDKAFTGVALELSPGNEFKKIDERVRLGLTAFWTKV